MHLQQQRGLRPNRVGIVARMSAIGRADFADGRAALRHHVGQSKRAANLDHLAARHDHFAPFGQRVEREHDSRGVVVDDGSGLGAGQRANLVLDDRIAIAASAGIQIVFQVDGGSRRHLDGLDRRLCQNRAPKIRMQHDPGRIDDRPQHRLIFRDGAGDSLHDSIDHRRSIARPRAASRENRGAQFRLSPLHHQLDVIAAKAGEGSIRLRGLDAFIDRRHRANQLRAHGGIGVFMLLRMLRHDGQIIKDRAAVAQPEDWPFDSWRARSLPAPPRAASASSAEEIRT